jgi:hypothetical protein
MDEFVTCPICQQPHRRGARFCPTTGKPLTQPLGSTPPFNAAQPGSAPVAGKPTAYTPAVNPPQGSPPCKTTPIQQPGLPRLPHPWFRCPHRDASV